MVSDGRVAGLAVSSAEAVDGWRLEGHGDGRTDRATSSSTRPSSTSSSSWRRSPSPVPYRGRPQAVGDRSSGEVYYEHEPAHIGTLEKAGFAAAIIVTDIGERIAAVRNRLEADGNLTVSAKLRRKKQTTRQLFIGLRGSSRLRLGRFPSHSTETKTDESESDTGEPAVGLVVSEQCQELVREFYSYKEDHVGGPNADDHCLDALRDAVMGVATPEQ
ncbi:hypothetical protein [Natronococcus roseus]|uniref:hypothetical protein n=1 Tax=Natronococcus roseus TaxID=1052014 RepID=UPI00374DE768